MPVRKVSNRGGNIIGRFPSLKLERMVDFESLIERDFIYMLDFDSDVVSFTEQPLTIEYEHEGKVLRYTPDFHVIRHGKSSLVECKPEKVVDSTRNQRKFAAGQAWCATQGWTFEVITDAQLRSGYRLSNVRFLTQFARYPISPIVKDRIRLCLSAVPTPTTVADLMMRVSPDHPQLARIPILHMAFHHELLLPLDKAPISGASPVMLSRRYL
jgi:hypothetical protein